MLRLTALFFLIISSTCAIGQTALLDSLASNVHKARQSQNLRAEADALEKLAREQTDLGQIYEGLKNVERAIEIYHSLGDKAEAYKSYNTIFTVHQQLHNGDKILEYALPALQYGIDTRDTQLILLMTNAAGIGYSQKGLRDKASEQYLACIDLERAKGQSTTYASVNAAGSFIEANNYPKGLEYARQSIRQASEERDTFVLAIAYICEAYALVNLGDALGAEEAIRHIEALEPSLPEAVIDRDLAALKHLVYAKKGLYKQAYEQFNVFYRIDSTLASTQRNAQFAALETTFRTKEKALENAQLNERITRQKTWIAGILGGLLLLGGLVFFQRNQLRIKAQLLAAEKQLFEAERQRAAEAQASHQRELADYTQLLVEKNQALDLLIQRRGSQEHQVTDRMDQPNEDWSAQLTEHTILTEADWRNFKQKFERVHPRFFERLKQAVPEITEAEKRLAALTKLSLSGAEIAAILGISPQTVIKTRYRFKKKINAESLEDLLAAI
jgi:DNA-binding CsgD family transcriptional regulator